MSVDLLQIGIVLVVIVFSMVLHELAHGFTAYFLGDTTAKDEGRLSFNPVKHLDPVTSVMLPLLLAISGGPIFGGAKPVPVDSRNLKGKEWGMALVAIAGPLTNLLIAFVAFLIGHFSGGMYATGVWSLIFSELILVNLGFFVFNLLPIPPLDGSRVLYAIAPDGAREVMTQIERSFGIYIVLILVVILGGMLSQFMSAIITGVLHGFFMLVGAG